MTRPLPCCVDVPPAAAGLVRYGVEELLRGLGLRPAWARWDEARLAVGGGEAPDPGRLVLPVSGAAVDALVQPRAPRPGACGWAAVDGERWPVPAGAPDEAPPGDLVASAAWWLAGLQERATAVRDRHGRFPYAASLQAALGDAPGGPLRPAVDAYRRWLGGALRARGVAVPGRSWGGKAWALALTHDLDAVRTRRVVAAVGEVVRGRPRRAFRRALGPDARWESIRRLRAVAERHGVRSTWFVKGGAWAPEDVPVRLDRRFRGRLRSLSAAGHAVGWHPGYGAHDHAGRLALERGRLGAALGHAPTVARTHFLRWAEPATPRLLLANGVRIDSTLGFAEHEGFRRGTAHPFRLYDVAADRATDLWEMPLAAMDTTLYTHRSLSDEAAAGALAAVVGAARRAGGVAVVLWHNSLDGDPAWGRRLHAFDQQVGQALAEGAAVAPLPHLLRAWGTLS